MNCLSEKESKLIKNKKNRIGMIKIKQNSEKERRHVILIRESESEYK